MPYIDPMLNAACNRQPPDPPDIVERLRETRCDREPFTPDHARCVCRLANGAADEIERLRALIDGRDAALRDCIKIAASDCEHEACKGIIERAGELVQLED